MRLLQRFLGMSHNALLFEIAALGCSEAEKATIMRDFQRARIHMWYYSTIKLS